MDGGETRDDERYTDAISVNEETSPEQESKEGVGPALGQKA